MEETVDTSAAAGKFMINMLAAIADFNVSKCKCKLGLLVEPKELQRVIKKIVIVLYGRTSADEQRKRCTIQNQIEYGKRYSRFRDSEISHMYLDDGVSGTIPFEEREYGRKLLEDAKNKKFDTVIVYKLDRLGRTIEVILEVLKKFEEYGIQFYSMTETIDTSTATGKFMINMLAAVADFERETILDRFFLGTLRVANEGKWVGGIAPYGYFVNSEGYLEINDNPQPGHYMPEADVVRLIFELITIQKYSTIRVANHLNSIGILKNSRKMSKGDDQCKHAIHAAWTPSAVLRIVRSKTYMGIHVYGTRSKKEDFEPIERQVPAIVDQSVWCLAQTVIDGNQIESMKNSTRDFILRGLIKCGCCNRSYMGTNYNDRNRSFYVCTGKYKFGDKCTSKNVPTDVVEDLVWKDIIRFIGNPGEVIKDVKQDVVEITPKLEDLQRRRDKCEKNLSHKKKERQSVIDLYRKEIISPLDLDAQLKIINDEEVTSQTVLKDLDEQINSLNNLIHGMNNSEDLLSNIKLKIDKGITTKDKREIIKLLVKTIYVNTEDSNGVKQASINIKYNFGKVID